MADFSFLSDSDDERAVEELLAQAMDHSVLEQVAAINCSNFTSDSLLPTHLETRFRKLKSFPSTNPNPLHLDTRNDSPSSSSFNSHFPPTKPLKPQSDDKIEFPSPPKEDPKRSDSSPENAIFSPPKQNTDEKMSLKSKSKSISFRSPSNSSNSSTESRSPPSRIGCFWCSPKRVSGKKSKKKNRSFSGVDLDWGKDDDEILSDLSTSKILKKAMKEEEKINREAEKIVKWAKQASARMMDVSGLEDELSDHENTK